jgi:hypothetical protein
MEASCHDLTHASLQQRYRLKAIGGLWEMAFVNTNPFHSLQACLLNLATQVRCLRCQSEPLFGFLVNILKVEHAVFAY